MIPVKEYERFLTIWQESPGKQNPILRDVGRPLLGLYRPCTCM